MRNQENVMHALFMLEKLSARIKDSQGFARPLLASGTTDMWSAEIDQHVESISRELDIKPPSSRPALPVGVIPFV